MPEEDIVWKNVLSSWVSEVGYDSENSTLLIKWAKGGQSSYAGVPPDVADEVSKSWSVGDTLRNMVIGKYPHSKVG